MMAAGTKIILCVFYSPPDAKKNKSLVNHIQLKYNELKREHPTSSTIILGDKNEMREEDLLSIDKNFSQIVKFPTRKEKTLDIVVTDLANLLNDPVKLPPIQVDDDKITMKNAHQKGMNHPKDSILKILFHLQTIHKVI